MSNPIRKIIEEYKDHADETLLKNFKFLHNGKTGYNDSFDVNYWQRKELIFELYHDYGPEHKPLIQWLLKEEQKGFEIDLPLYTLDVCAFMLYKYMSNEDVYALYHTKFGAGTDAQVYVDIELIFGYDKEHMKQYLTSDTQNIELNKKILATIEYYESDPDVIFRNREAYIDHFENKKIKGIKGDLEDFEEGL
ncbi:hypothetical protein B0A69_21490 [Chryseobacterium shigense]|uniref:Uncharacterized protein n=1 Tax=Chryseobacterium shigense TaxID=297244 RepID=A0A1N7IJ95_9FLAO|nr:hypothetical protein [Chryseobacterium shigense]PQA89997.1 hypothetical protein B0A69_21490 [Chryseobacterium shigense]SIS37137.1 hypothetical protein SAMN05421639_10428 [Chryseobacterium shigense]